MLNPEAVSQTDNPVAAVRAFNRFYTKKLGVLDQHLMQSPFSLSEARVIYELAHRGTVIAKQIGEELGLDPGYLSRIVQGFEDKGLVTRTPLPSDRRQQQLALTTKGRQAFAKLDRSSDSEVATGWSARWARSPIFCSRRPRRGRRSCCAAIAPAISAG
jgi:DNA-binding MarR family transcriptional regulator